MKVALGSLGRFHIFDLARQMNRLGVLDQFYTGYPSWKVDGIAKSQLKTFPWLVTPYMMASRLGAEKFQNLLYRPMVASFDNWMAKNLQPTDIFHCLSGFGTKTFQKARQNYGAITICDRGSTHIRFQKEILEEEYSRWGQKLNFGTWGYERELQEYAQCDLIVIPSHFVQKTFVKYGIPKEKLACVPYGVDLSIFKPYPKEDQVFRVIYVGALSLRKGIPYLLEAIASLKLPNFELWLIGGITPEIKPVLQRYKNHFKYFGFIPRVKLAQYYSQASVFVIASIEEGLALVQAQAMACGVPVIATENTGAEDLFQNGQEGFIIAARDPEAIREKITFLYDHLVECQRMAQNALKKVSQLEGWDSYGESIVEVYEQNLSKRN
jgi:glycosyltransferase involved in cell wall biosynthesis